MGENRELKFALEKFWRRDIAAADLLAVAHQVEQSAWTLQVDAGIDRITVGDHCLYDNVATWAESLGIVPSRFASLEPGMDRMFSMCRGIDGAEALSKYHHVAYNNKPCMYACYKYLRSQHVRVLPIQLIPSIVWINLSRYTFYYSQV